MASPLAFPTFLGLGYSVVRRPKGSTSIQTHVSGREVRVGYWTYPLYEWDLTFDVLRDFPRDPANYNTLAVIDSELKRLQGFFLAMQGSLSGFAFLDPDDHQVTGQALAITDGVTSSYLILRTYGDVSYGATVTEPVGAVATSSLNVYLNGVLQSGWTETGNPGSYFVTFPSPPAHGLTLTADFIYYFYVRFQNDTLDFEKFMDKYWTVKKVTLVSLRG